MDEIKEVLIEGEEDHSRLIHSRLIAVNLDEIKKIVEGCKEKSSAVKVKFETVYEALNELQENSVRRSGESAETLTELVKDEMANETEQKKILEQLADLEKAEINLQNEMVKYEAKMETARKEAEQKEKVGTRQV